MVSTLCKGKRSAKNRRCVAKRCGYTNKCPLEPVSSDGFLNYLRIYRKTHHGVKPKEIIRRVVKKWCGLKREHRLVYKKMDFNNPGRRRKPQKPLRGRRKGVRRPRRRCRR